MYGASLAAAIQAEEDRLVGTQVAVDIECSGAVVGKFAVGEVALAEAVEEAPRHIERAGLMAVVASSAVAHRSSIVDEPRLVEVAEVGAGARRGQ